MSDKNIHSGHRARLREEFRIKGFKDWSEHKVLEYVLQRVLPRVDTNGIAHMMINKCEGFENVFSAPKEQLEDVIGVGKETAEYIHMLGELIRYYNNLHLNKSKFELNSETCEDYMLKLFSGEEHEIVYIICLDAANHILLREVIFEGGFETVEVDIARIMRIAIKSNAAYIVLAHNHPSGISIPSNADIVTTQTIERALHLGGIKLLDHIVVAGRKCTSMRSGGYLTSRAGIVNAAAYNKKNPK